MAILKIARMGHPILHRVADPIDDPTAPQVAAVVADMLDTLVEYDGVGLAAPQIHVSRRLVLLSIPRRRAAAEDGADPPAEDGVDTPAETEPAEAPPTALINPLIEPVGDTMEEGWEACLSVPGLAGYVPRYTHIRYAYQTLAGDRVEAEARGFAARVLQHEIDHLDGVLYPMRITDMRRFGFVREMQRAAPREDARENAGDEAPDGD